jgi:hypothetical protein
LSVIQESRSLWALEDLTPEEIEEHIAEMNDIRNSWGQLLASQRHHLTEVEGSIEAVRVDLFQAERKELAGLKK